MPLAAHHVDALSDGLLALGEQGSVSGRVEEKLRQYLALLTKWNKVYNLTAITEPEQMITQHVLDSLAIAEPLDSLLLRKHGARVLDVGSGAGLPGIPLAIARPAWQLTLLDSNSKKTAFIAQAAAEIGLSNVSVATARAESFVSAPFDVIVCRAFSSLRDFVTKTRSLLVPAGWWAAMKGGVPHDELRVLPFDVECRDLQRLQVPGLDAERHLLLLKVKAE
jgi:16S rRNA (guanine527-N7)-methyltransferase